MINIKPRFVVITTLLISIGLTTGACESKEAKRLWEFKLECAKQKSAFLNDQQQPKFFVPRRQGEGVVEVFSCQEDSSKAFTISDEKQRWVYKHGGRKESSSFGTVGHPLEPGNHKIQFSLENKVWREIPVKVQPNKQYKIVVDLQEQTVQLVRS